jgi:hypothetical protein
MNFLLVLPAHFLSYLPLPHMTLTSTGKIRCTEGRKGRQIHHYSPLRKGEQPDRQRVFTTAAARARQRDCNLRADGSASKLSQRKRNLLITVLHDNLCIGLACEPCRIRKVSTDTRLAGSSFRSMGCRPYRQSGAHMWSC